MSDICVVHGLPEADWRRFLAENSNSNIFHTPEMFELFSMAKYHRPSLWAAVDKAGHPLALFLPVQINVFGGLLRQFTTRAVVYGSVLCEPTDNGKKALAVLLESYVQETNRKSLFTELRNLSNLEDVQPILCEQGFVYEDHLNYIIDLNLPAEAMFQNIGKRTRKNIQRALNRGDVVIREVEMPKDIAICYDLLRRTYHSARVPLADRSLFDAAFTVLHPKGMIRLVLAYVGQVPVATSIELMYKDVVYGWYSGMDRRYSRYMPNELLMWNILQWGASGGYRIYDFGGAGKPDVEYGVREFKAKFGGTLVCFGRNTFVHAPLGLRLGTLGYDILRKFF
jgi:serine/alanine adding enzyme